MKKRNHLLPLLFLALLFAVFLIRRWNEPKRREAFDRHPALLVFTNTARCNMTCRQIDEAEVRETIQNGIINFSLSDHRYRPCPVFALQGKTSTGLSLRIFLAQCSKKTFVLNCYNLKKRINCACADRADQNFR